MMDPLLLGVGPDRPRPSLFVAPGGTSVGTFLAHRDRPDTSTGVSSGDSYGGFVTLPRNPEALAPGRRLPTGGHAQGRNRHAKSRAPAPPTGRPYAIVLRRGRVASAPFGSKRQVPPGLSTGGTAHFTSAE